MSQTCMIAMFHLTSVTVVGLNQELHDSTLVVWKKHFSRQGMYTVYWKPKSTTNLKQPILMTILHFDWFQCMVVVHSVHLKWCVGFGYALLSPSNIRLSSNARRALFEYPQIYFNKKGKVCKARVNEWVINQI
jgi:hypothetical protein